MRKIHQLALLVCLVALLWALAWSSTSDSSPLLVRVAAGGLPLWLLTAFGIYALTLLIWGVLTFRTVPSEAEALRADIDEARIWLRKHGIE
jgi:Dolichol-phosphate mannosyltransferase subunit 3 (DPM3)